MLVTLHLNLRRLEKSFHKWNRRSWFTRKGGTECDVMTLLVTELTFTLILTVRERLLDHFSPFDTHEISVGPGHHPTNGLSWLSSPTVDEYRSDLLSHI